VAHVRIRKYNTNDYYPDQQLGIDLSMAVRAGNHVFVRGQTAMTFDGGIIGVGDPEAQTEHAMKCVKILLEEAGAKLEHICKIHIYVIDRAYREPVYRVVGKWLKGVYPCSTGLIVSALARPELLMEIDVDAVIPADEMPKGKAASTWNTAHLRKKAGAARKATGGKSKGRRKT
jgi:enamine deaminase RidA (YjgF/YER057c/UK114 family)